MPLGVPSKPLVRAIAEALISRRPLLQTKKSTSTDCKMRKGSQNRSYSGFFVKPPKALPSEYKIIIGPLGSIL
jgi:hypothetical protein